MGNEDSKFKYRVTGARGAVYETTTLVEARKIAGKNGVIESISYEEQAKRLPKGHDNWLREAEKGARRANFALNANARKHNPDSGAWPPEGAHMSPRQKHRLLDSPKSIGRWLRELPENRSEQVNGIRVRRVDPDYWVLDGTRLSLQEATVQLFASTGR